MKCDTETNVERVLEQIFPKFNIEDKLPDPGLVLFYQELASYDIWLDDEISWSSVGTIVRYIQYLNRTKTLEEVPEIKLHIMSNGGELPSMFTLYDALKASKIPIHTVNEGACHSAAFIVYLAGSVRTMHKHSCFIAHEGSGVTGGTFRESRAAMKQYEYDVNTMKEIIAENTNLSYEEIDNHFALESDWYIRQDEAEKYGIITEKED